MKYNLRNKHFYGVAVLRLRFFIHINFVKGLLKIGQQPYNNIDRLG